MIKQLHFWLLQYSEKDIRHRGQYKTIGSHIEAFDSYGKSLGVIFETTSHTTLKKIVISFFLKTISK